MMRCRIGLEVRAADLRAVLLRSNAVAWHARVELNDAVPLADSVAMLLAQRPKNAGERQRLAVALGFSRAQVKRLDGLPQLAARAQMTQLLQEHVSAVFLADAGQLAIPEAYRSATGTWWGAVFPRVVVAGVVAGAGRAGLTVHSIVSTACALARIHPNGSAAVDDGGAIINIAIEAGELRDLRRSQDSADAVSIPESLGSLGDDAAAYAGAYAAAIGGRRIPLSWNVEPPAARTAVLRRARTAAMAASVAVAGTAALVAPGVRAMLVVRRASSSVDSADRRIEMIRAESDLGRATQLLASVARFDSSRGAVMRLLAHLGQSLPESTAIVSLRVDSAEGSFTAVAPHVTDVLEQLGNVDRIHNARIIGGVTHEVVGGARVERATFRFLRTRSVQVSRSGASAQPRGERR